MLCIQGSALETVYDFNLLKVDETRVRAAPRVGQTLVHCDFILLTSLLESRVTFPRPLRLQHLLGCPCRTQRPYLLPDPAFDLLLLCCLRLRFPRIPC